MLYYCDIDLILLHGINTINVSTPKMSHFSKEGGGLRISKMSPFKIVTIGMGREGLRANLDTVTKYSDFFF